MNSTNKYNHHTLHDIKNTCNSRRPSFVNNPFNTITHKTTSHTKTAYILSLCISIFVIGCENFDDKEHNHTITGRERETAREAIVGKIRGALIGAADGRITDPYYTSTNTLINALSQPHTNFTFDTRQQIPPSLTNSSISIINLPANISKENIPTLTNNLPDMWFFTDSKLSLTTLTHEFIRPSLIKIENTIFFDTVKTSTRDTVAPPPPKK